jgi:hypothetical protein
LKTGCCGVPVAAVSVRLRVNARRDLQISQ